MSRFIYPLLLLSLSTSVSKASECYATLDGDTLRIGNSVVERVLVWNDGALATARIAVKGAAPLVADASAPDFIVNRSVPADARLDTITVAPDGVTPEQFLATVSYKAGPLDVRRVYRIVPGVPAIACDTYLRGILGDNIPTGNDNAADRTNIESKEAMKVTTVTSVLDRIRFNGAHWHGRAVEFRDVTDWNNNLVSEQDFISYRRTPHRGNILIVSDGTGSRGGVVMLKEAPSSSSQLSYTNADFFSDFGDFTVTGTGLNAADVVPDKWTQAYSTVMIPYCGSELDALTALRSYQKTRRIMIPGRDEMVMMNTWGDRSQDSKVNEAFCLAELERASRLGITHFQIDDGWQSGKSPNSAVAKGSFKDIWRNADYWKPDTMKYPRGLRPVVDRAHELGIEIGLWFNPSVQDDFADWEKDAATLVGLYRDYGIRMFKIDGLAINSKLGEERLRRLFDKVMLESGNKVVFNLDATAGRRAGYHMLNRYGNIFLENRYTDWGNYYPYHTLRNLWMLSKYVPAEILQIEFLNKWRNTDKYPSGDPFAPVNYSFDYLFAVTMAGQPLAWMEAANLPEEAFATSSLIKEYRSVQHAFHQGTILPVGEEPSGRSFTGFQSVISPYEGFLLLYRESTPESTRIIDTWLPEGTDVQLIPVLGDTEQTQMSVAENGRIRVSLRNPDSFAMYRYKIIGIKK